MLMSKREVVIACSKVGEAPTQCAMMTGIFPPYRDYQAKTEREIPVVVLEPKEEIARL